MTLLTSGGQGFSLECGGRQPSVSTVPINKSVAWSALIIALTQPHAPPPPPLLCIAAIPPFHLLAPLLPQPQDLFSPRGSWQRLTARCVRGRCKATRPLLNPRTLITGPLNRIFFKFPLFFFLFLGVSLFLPGGFTALKLLSAKFAIIMHVRGFPLHPAASCTREDSAKRTSIVTCAPRRRVHFRQEFE